ncbi:membrane-bound PQQ-dependent dehydrogenase, glucose/quinate/shikimate family, partial [Rhizobium ruizarguesonis]
MNFLATLFCLVLAFIGLGLIGGCAWLLRLGGSPYYAIVGLAYVVGAFLLWRRKISGSLIVLLVAVFTLPWALWESGLNFWALFARLMSPIALAGFALFFAPSLSPT